MSGYSDVLLPSFTMGVLEPPLAAYSMLHPRSLSRSLESRCCLLRLSTLKQLTMGSQHFWGSMVASTGAGPLPIPYHSLDVAGFARSIMHCLDPPTRNAARMVAMKIKSESGIKAAVQSFHAHLPSNLHCDVVKEQAAAWLYKDKHCTLKLSKIAAAALLSQSIVKRERFSQ